jgi:intein/homing endonuclease
VSEIKRGKKTRVYCIRIAGNSKTDKDYIFRYIPDLFMKVFNEKGSTMTTPNRDCGYFTVYGKNLVEYIKSLEICSGNKKENGQGIPNWIKADKILLARCIKGLLDTDGSIHKISKGNKNLRIDFTSKIPRLLADTHKAFISLGFHTSKIICQNHFFLSRQDEVEKYVREIGFSNSKNLKRYLNLKNH